jgi:acyl-CoA synthetase (AMP-forming)/AMP-acid ligase II
MLSHSNLAAVMVQFSDLPTGCALSPHKIGEEQAVGLSVIPMYHVYGLVINTMHALLLGSKVVVLPKFEPGSFLSCLARHTPQFLNIVPPLVSFLALSPLVTRETHLPRAICICSGGSPLSSQVEPVEGRQVYRRWRRSVGRSGRASGRRATA